MTVEKSEASLRPAADKIIEAFMIHADGEFARLDSIGEKKEVSAETTASRRLALRSLVAEKRKDLDSLVERKIGELGGQGGRWAKIDPRVLECHPGENEESPEDRLQNPDAQNDRVLADASTSVCEAYQTATQAIFKLFSPENLPRPKFLRPRLVFFAVLVGSFLALWGLDILTHEAQFLERQVTACEDAAKVKAMDEVKGKFRPGDEERAQCHQAEKLKTACEKVDTTSLKCDTYLTSKAKCEDKQFDQQSKERIALAEQATKPLIKPEGCPVTSAWSGSLYRALSNDNNALSLARKTLLLVLSTLFAAGLVGYILSFWGEKNQSLADKLLEAVKDSFSGGAKGGDGGGESPVSSLLSPKGIIATAVAASVGVAGVNSVQQTSVSKEVRDREQRTTIEKSIKETVLPPSEEQKVLIAKLGEAAEALKTAAEQPKTDQTPREITLNLRPLAELSSVRESVNRLEGQVGSLGRQHDDFMQKATVINELSTRIETLATNTATKDSLDQLAGKQRQAIHDLCIAIGKFEEISNDNLKLMNERSIFYPLHRPDLKQGNSPVNCDELVKKLGSRQ